MAWKISLKEALLMSVIILGPGGSPAAPGPEPVDTVIEAVDVAARRIQAGNVEYALSSTVMIRWSSGAAVTLKDLTPGTRVRLELVPPRGRPGRFPVVAQVLLLAD